MKVRRYRGTDIPVRRGDVVRWLSDESTSEVLFVVSTGDFPDHEDEDSREWFRTEFGEGIMLNTPSGGWYLSQKIARALVRSASERA